MSQFKPKQSFTKRNPPEDGRASTYLVVSDTAANVTYNVSSPGPETTPMPGMIPGRGLLRSPMDLRSSQPGKRKQMSMEPTSDSGLYVEQKGIQRNLPVVRTTGQLSPNPISIAIPLSTIPTTSQAQRMNLSRDHRMPVVIPGKRTRLPDTDAISFRRRHHLSARWRHSLAILATLGTFIIMMLSLTPLGQSNSAGINGLLNTISVPRTQNLNLLARGGSDNSSSNGFNDPGGGDRARYVALARQDALKYGISPDLYERQIQQESHFDPNAYSYVGAIGIAQFMPATAAEMGFDPRDPVAALDGGARFMGNLNSRFYGDYAKALAAYNAGPGAVDIAVNNCGGAWLSCMDPQAQAYVYIIEGW